MLYFPADDSRCTPQRRLKCLDNAYDTHAYCISLALFQFKNIPAGVSDVLNREAIGFDRQVPLCAVELLSYIRTFFGWSNQAKKTSSHQANLQGALTLMKPLYN